MKLIGLTGGISSGKSTVSKYIKEHTDIRIIDADKISKEMYKDEAVIKAVISAFGSRILNKNNKIDSKLIRGVVFGDLKELDKLNGIMRPNIINKIKEAVDEAVEENKTTVIDAPVLFESGLEKVIDFDDIIVVSIPQELQIQRLIKRDDIDRDLALKMINGQINPEERIKRGSIIINNDSTLDNLIKQIEIIINKF